MTCQAATCQASPAANELLCARHWAMIPKLWQDRWLVALKDRRGAKGQTTSEKLRRLKWEFHCESCLKGICRRVDSTPTLTLTPTPPSKSTSTSKSKRSK